MQLKRAKSDAAVVKLYDIVRKSMRDVREESDARDVDGIVEEMMEHSESLQDLVSETSFGAGTNTTVATLDDDELEKELLEALASEEKNCSDIKARKETPTTDRNKGAVSIMAV